MHSIYHSSELRNGYGCTHGEETVQNTTTRQRMQRWICTEVDGRLQNPPFPFASSLARFDVKLTGRLVWLVQHGIFGSTLHPSLCDWIYTEEDDLTVVSGGLGVPNVQRHSSMHLRRSHDILAAYCQCSFLGPRQYTFVWEYMNIRLYLNDGGRWNWECVIFIPHREGRPALETHQLTRRQRLSSVTRTSQRDGIAKVAAEGRTPYVRGMPGLASVWDASSQTMMTSLVLQYYQVGEADFVLKAHVFIYYVYSNGRSQQVMSFLQDPTILSTRMSNNRSLSSSTTTPLCGVESDDGDGYICARKVSGVLTVLKDATDGYQIPHGSPPQMYDHILPLLNCSRSVCEGGRSIRLIWLSSSARPPVPSTKPSGELIKVLVLVLVRKWKERWVCRRVDGWRYGQIGVDGRLERKFRIDAWSYGRLQHTPPRRKMDVRVQVDGYRLGELKLAVWIQYAPFPFTADCRGRDDLIFGVCPRFMTHLDRGHRVENQNQRRRAKDRVFIFGAHAERRVCGGILTCTVKLTNRRYDYNIYSSHPSAGRDSPLTMRLGFRESALD
ncbi:uncharacterized protein ARMOST_19908 [Armillaria ostoyae]|uniref:Uncharacterized protein n=1 Tax=Armillaria ostoyae TaxID=47428 RepID=A0A284S5V4_ARMOS|nr:uncharacterized protein ARMOST_19908 [Armillaria ostoyae]